MMSTCIGESSVKPWFPAIRPKGAQPNRPSAVRYPLATVSKIVQTGSIRPFGTTFGAETATASDTWLCNLARWEPLEAGILNPRRSATLAIAFYPAAIIAGWGFVSLTGTASPRLENAAVAHAVDRLAPSLTASIDATARPQIANRSKPLQQAKQLQQALSCPIRPKWRRRPNSWRSPFIDMKPVAEATAAEPEPKRSSSPRSAIPRKFCCRKHRPCRRPRQARPIRRLKTRNLRKPGPRQAASRLSASAWWSSPASINICMRSMSGRPRKTPSRRPRSARWRSSAGAKW